MLGVIAAVRGGRGVHVGARDQTRDGGGSGDEGLTDDAVVPARQLVVSHAAESDADDRPGTSRDRAAGGRGRGRRGRRGSHLKGRVAEQVDQFLADHDRLQKLGLSESLQIFEGLARELGFIRNVVFEALAAEGSEIVVRGLVDDARPAAFSQAHPQAAGVDAGDRLPVGLQAEAARDAADHVPERGQDRQKLDCDGVEVIALKAGRRRAGLGVRLQDIVVRLGDRRLHGVEGRLGGKCVHGNFPCANRVRARRMARA